MHSDFGPLGQDKDTNQDYALAWVRGESASDSFVQWAIALADGVTASRFAEYGAESVCWAALTALTSNQGDLPNRAKTAMLAAGEAIGKISDVIESNADFYLPSGEYNSTWRYTLREGLLLQTTLSLVWQENGEIHLAFIGDGGAIVERMDTDGRRIEVIGLLDETTSRVHALGPTNREIRDADVTRSYVVDEITRLAIFTDGVGRGLGGRPETLLQQINEFPNQDTNVAKKLIESWIRELDEEFQDNLTLAIVNS